MTDTLLVSITHSPPDHAVLVVGKKKNEAVEILNAFQGKEALELYQRLIMVNKPTE